MPTFRTSSRTTPVTDEQLKAEYDRITATITGTEYKARHILVGKEPDAKDIIAKLKKDPGAFGKLAMERSKDDGSKSRGGDLGWFDPRRMVPEFAAALTKLEKGKFTVEPVKTQFGYHVILLEDSRPSIFRVTQGGVTHTTEPPRLPGRFSSRCRLD